MSRWKESITFNPDCTQSNPTPISSSFFYRVGNKKGKKNFAETGRDFLKEGHLQLAGQYSLEHPTSPSQSSRSGPKKLGLKVGKTMFWILFNDIVVWAEPKEKRKNLLNSTLRFEALKELSTSNLQVFQQLDEEDIKNMARFEEECKDAYFKLMTMDQVFILKCESFLEKKGWVNALSKAISSQN